MEDDIIKDYIENGMTVIAISDKYNVGRKKVSAILKSAGVEIRNVYKIEIPPKEDIISIYDEPGGSISKVARHFNTTNPTVRKWMEHHNIYRKSHKETSASVNQMTIEDECIYIDELRLYLEKSKSLTQTKKKFKITSSQLKHWIEKYNLEVSENKFCRKPIPPKEELEKLINSGITYKDMLKKLDVSYHTLIKWLGFHKLIQDKKVIYQNMTNSISNTKLELYGYSHFPDSVYETHSVSKGETELKEYLNSLGFNFKKKHIYIEEGVRRELDMYDENKKIAIEFSGAYWHCQLNNPDKNYHYKKWKWCSDNGIQLMTFWDLEISQNKEKILSFIKSKLGVFENTIFARNTMFKEVNIKQYKFFENNHIQGGNCNIDRNFGLFDEEGEMVACVSFTKHHRDNTKYTLNRLAFKKYVQVVGGASKLIKNALEQVDRDVITWSDNRFSTGELYEKCGFKLETILKPDYVYYDVKKNKILSKQSQQKKNTGCPPDMTEKEYGISLGRYQLWDCGKKRYIFAKKDIDTHQNH